MTKKVVATIFILLLMGMIFLATNLKSAYRVLPMTTSDKLVVPEFAEWREFVAQSGRFKVKLPYVPQYAKEAVNIPNTDKKRHYEMYASEKMNGTTFMISLITYPAEVDTSDQAQMLNDVVNEMMATNPSNQLKESAKDTYHDHQAVDFHIVNREFDVQGKAFMVDKTMYLLTYVSKTPDFNEKEYDYFLKYFQLLKPLEK